MIVSTEEFNHIISMYGIKSKIIKFEELQNCSYDICNMRLIYLLYTNDKKKFVCKMTNESNYPAWLIEKQSQFAMFLYKNGISTAIKLNSNGKYCVQWIKNKLIFCITLETYAGEDLKKINSNTFKELGKLLGRIHAISQAHNYRIGFSMTMDAIRKGRARYKNILVHAKHNIICRSEIRKIAHLHDSLVHIVYGILPHLPQGGVHADIGIFNNILVYNDTLTVIDFNLSCDEAYLIDLAASFYSSFYKFCINMNFKHTNIFPLLYTFLDGYTDYRKLTKIEEQNFEIISSLMNGIFYTKYIITQYNNNFQYNYLKYFNEIADIFSSGITLYTTYRKKD